jgi:hypothetical protein
VAGAEGAEVEGVLRVEHDRSVLPKGGRVGEDHLRLETSAGGELSLAPPEDSDGDLACGAGETLRVDMALHSPMVARRGAHSRPGNPQH